MKKFPCIESMTRVAVDGLVVRVWREEESIQETYENSDIAEEVRRICGAYYEASEASRKDIVAALVDLPRINAVEVTNVNGDGVVVYVNWP